jgi:alcohol dehydrogenase class IV
VFGERNPDQMVGIGRAMGLAKLQATPEAVPQVAGAIEAFFGKLGLKTRLRDYGVPQHMLPHILEFSMKNYNADRNRHFLKEIVTLKETLDQAW